jgi:hypothetical protein
MRLTPEIARRACQAILALARKRLITDPERPIWLDDPDNEQTGNTLQAALLFSQLTPVRPSDPTEREEQIIQNTMELLMETGCDWTGWAACADITEGKRRTVWLRFHTEELKPCSRCRTRVLDGFMPQWPPLRFVCTYCRDRLREEELKGDTDGTQNDY